MLQTYLQFFTLLALDLPVVFFAPVVLVDFVLAIFLISFSFINGYPSMLVWEK